jgi:hypothetical protein
VCLLLERDDLPGLGKRREDRSKAGFDRRHRAVKQDQRSVGAVDLVIHVESFTERLVSACGDFIASLCSISRVPESPWQA